MRRRRFIGAVGAGAAAVAGCLSPDLEDPPEPGEQAAWRWVHEFEVLEAVTVAHGQIYTADGSGNQWVGGRENAVVAVDPSSGTERWRIPVDWVQALEADSGGVYTFADESATDLTDGEVPHIGRIDQNGSVVWHRDDTEFAPEPDARFAASPAALLVYNKRLIGSLVGYKKETGERRWEQVWNANDFDLDLVGFTDQRVYTRPSQDTLRARDAAEGTIQWEQDVDPERFGAESAARADRVYMLDDRDQGHVISGWDAASGEQRWSAHRTELSFNNEAPTMEKLVPLENGILVAGTPPVVYTRDGAVRWESSVEGEIAGVMIGAEHVFIQFDNDSGEGVTTELLAFNPEADAIAWTRQFGKSLALWHAAEGFCYLVQDEEDPDSNRTEDEVFELDARDGGTTTWRGVVLGSPVAAEGRDLYTEIEPTDQARGGLYAYTPESRSE